MLSYFLLETGVAVTVNLAPFAEYNALSIVTQLLICSDVALGKIKHGLFPAVWTPWVYTVVFHAKLNVIVAIKEVPEFVQEAEMFFSLTD